jgi:hypothetical protein
MALHHLVATAARATTPVRFIAGDLARGMWAIEIGETLLYLPDCFGSFGSIDYRKRS